MELMQAIKERRSIRKFEDRPVPDDALRTVLEAVQWSPSWANTQVWEVVVVKDQPIKEKLSETLGKGNPAGKAMVNAPVLMVLCGKKESSGYYSGVKTTKFGDWLMFDLGLAAQNLCLAAHGLGLGTVIVGLFDQDRAAGVLGVPETHELVAMIPMGYPAKEPPAPKRREATEFTHYDRY